MARAASSGALVALAALLCASQLLQGAAALYSSGTPVLQLDSANFRTKLKAAGAALVEFYAPWWVRRA